MSRRCERDRRATELSLEKMPITRSRRRAVEEEFETPPLRLKRRRSRLLDLLDPGRQPLGLADGTEADQ